MNDNARPARLAKRDATHGGDAARRKRQAHLRERATYRLALISRRLTVALAEVHSSKYGLSISSWKLLSIIDAFGPLSAREASGHSSLDPTRVTRAAGILVDQGLVARTEDADDRRRVVLTLTAKGKRVHGDVQRVSSGIEDAFLGVLTPAERESLHTLLEKLEPRSREILAHADHGGRRNERT